MQIIQALSFGMVKETIYYKLMAQNFTAEVAEFFMKGKRSPIVSKPQAIQMLGEQKQTKHT